MQVRDLGRPRQPVPQRDRRERVPAERQLDADQAVAGLVADARDPGVEESVLSPGEAVQPESGVPDAAADVIEAYTTEEVARTL